MWNDQIKNTLSKWWQKLTRQQRTITTGRDYVERVEGNVNTGDHYHYHAAAASGDPEALRLAYPLRGGVRGGLMEEKETFMERIRLVCDRNSQKTGGFVSQARTRAVRYGWTRMKYSSFLCTLRCLARPKCRTSLLTVFIKRRDTHV